VTFKLVIFDCDGVLIDSEKISAMMLIRTLADHSVNVDMAYVAQHFLGRSYPTVLAQVRREFGVVLSEAFEAEYRERLLAAFDTELVVTPGVISVLDRLKVADCVATSSSPRRVHRSLTIVGLWPRFEGRVFTASEVANGKPAPDLFLHVAARMNVEPADCLVIEDSLNGIRAAKAAGMTVWRYTGGSHISDADRDGPTRQEVSLSFDDFSRFFDHAPELER
jgi:HAD superfamily hydrolase (TIGR01509 family)